MILKQKKALKIILKILFINDFQIECKNVNGMKDG